MPTLPVRLKSLSGQTKQAFRRRPQAVPSFRLLPGYAVPVRSDLVVVGDFGAASLKLEPALTENGMAAA
jgi:hypothetical protein